MTTHPAVCWAGCHAVSYDIEKNQFVRCYGYHNLGGCSLVGDEPHGLSMAGNMFYGQHRYDTAGGVDIHSRRATAAHDLRQRRHPPDLAQDAQGRQGPGFLASPSCTRTTHNTISSMTFSDGRVFIITKQTNALFVFQGQRNATVKSLGLRRDDRCGGSVRCIRPARGRSFARAGPAGPGSPRQVQRAWAGSASRCRSPPPAGPSWDDT